MRCVYYCMFLMHALASHREGLSADLFADAWQRKNEEFL